MKATCTSTALTGLLLLALATPAWGQRPVSEIASGRAINEWLEKITETDPEPRPMLDRKVMEGLNLTWAGQRGGVWMIRRPDKVDWSDFVGQADRDEWQKLAAEAVKEAKKGPVSAGVLRRAGQLYKRLDEDLNAKAEELTPTEYIHTRRLLNLLKYAIDLLKGPRFGRLLAAADEVASGRRSVPALAELLRKEKLAVGPAPPGQEDNYRTLERALAAYCERKGRK
jgi:hypothetical protein